MVDMTRLYVVVAIMACSSLWVEAEDLQDFTEICKEEPATGSCRAKIPMWYYNHTTSTCEQFIYGGCRGSMNRFRSEEECFYKCTDACKQPPATGNCRAKLPAWYYNETTGTCEQFIYGGCRGSRNRFSTKQECIQTCSEDICSLSPVTGACKANIRLWYYNPATRACHQFTFGGCGGNDNKFPSEHTCLVACGKSNTPCNIDTTFQTVGHQAVHEDYREKDWFLVRCNSRCETLCLKDHPWGYCMAYSVRQRWYGCNCYLYSRYISQAEFDPDTKGLSKNRNCQ